MLQEFLNNNFMVITEDANHGKLKKASDELVKKIQKAKSKVSIYTMIALDPEISPDNPDVVEVKDLIIKFWSTFPSSYKDTPVTYIRAVILEALKSSAIDLNTASLIWYSGKNVIRYYSLLKQKDLLLGFILEQGNKIEDETYARWSNISDVKIDKLTLDLKGLPGEAVEKTELDKNLKEVRSTINKIAAWSASDTDQNKLTQLKTNLLWWKEARYSNTFKSSYRGLEPEELQFSLALDFSHLVPTVHPKSAEVFLKEVYLDLAGGEDKKVRLNEISRKIEASAKLKHLFRSYTLESGRISLSSFYQGLSQGLYDQKQFKNLVGVKESTEILSSELVEWLFNDFQAQKIVGK
jgi:hypothetical protein